MDFASTTSSIYANSSAILAAGGLAPDQIPGLGWFTNSIFVAIVVLLVVLGFCRMATKRMDLIPGKKQNLVEFVIEFLYGQVENVVGKKVAPKAFPLLATLFIFILVSNYSGLIPGVGTVGFSEDAKNFSIPAPDHSAHAEDHGAHEGREGEAADKPAIAHDDHAKEGKDAHGKDGHAKFTPLLRPPTADLNMTLAMAAVFMIVWTLITIREVGVMGFIAHTFGPKGGLTGFLKYALMPIFIFVGMIEIISIAARPVSLSLRLLGNIFAGETLLHTMAHLGASFGLGKVASFISSIVLPLPFYFLEILVGLLQAMVFSLLCAVYIQLSTAEEEH